MNSSPLSQFLAAHPDVEAVELLITDPNGVSRGKIIAREELDALFDHGRCVAGSILGLDVTGQDVEDTGLVWTVGDADMVCRPVDGTLVRSGWTRRATAQVLMSMYTMEGQPSIADPRHVLSRAIARMQQTGYTPVMAAEIEFYLLELDEHGRLCVARSQSRNDAYGLQKLQSLSAVFDEIYACARAQELPVRTLMSEYAPGQYEITLQHRRDALRAMDDAILFKRLVRGVAAKHGLIACFMAKPFAEHAGSGMHMHLSLANNDGANVFASDAPAGTPILRHAIAGMQQRMAETMLVFAPHANSYRRFRSMSYAPVAPTWGINNRSVSLRVPSGVAATRHIEHRVSGADANPYLVAATIIEAARIGIEQKMDPGPPVSGNGYASNVSPSLPRDWYASIQAAHASAFLREAFGDFHQNFLAIKRQEYEKFNAQVTALDYDWYLDTI